MSAAPVRRDPASWLSELLTGLLLGLLVLAWGMAYRGTLAQGWSDTLLRQSGTFGYLLLAATCVLGPLIGTRFLPQLLTAGLKSGWHGLLAGFALTLGAVHGAFSLVGPDALSLQAALIPGQSGWRTVSMAAGTLGLWLMAAVYATYALRGRLGLRAARVLHLLAYPAFVAATLHSVWLGHAGQPEPLYLISSLAVGLALALRLLTLATRPAPLALPGIREVQ
ncbi:ferric reductase [Deinococcus sonorensis]|uniref:Ferric reductase n=2 Tax=Deinococcus sonorensis TaxID=309891 RepID=A0AAU7UES0_9DEIO